MGVDQTAEGWFGDPFGIHEQRWISQGRPTSLVRDGDMEGKDEPPHRPPTRPFVPVAESSPGRRDLLRADDANAAPIPDSGTYAVAAMDANVVFDNAAIGGPAPAGDRSGIMYETSFQHKMWKREKKRRRAERWHRWFGRNS